MTTQPKVGTAEIRRLHDLAALPEKYDAYAWDSFREYLSENAIAIADALDENAALRIENRVLMNRLIALESQND